jgi:hypothetical protein
VLTAAHTTARSKAKRLSVRGFEAKAAIRAPRLSATTRSLLFRLARDTLRYHFRRRGRLGLGARRCEPTKPQRHGRCVGVPGALLAARESADTSRATARSG